MIRPNIACSKPLIKILMVLPLCLLFVVGGCANHRANKIASDPELQPPPPQRTVTQPPPSPPNSVYSDSGRYVGLFSDVKARSVGDLVTVQITENATASQNTQSQSSRKSDGAASMANVLGLETYFNPPTDPTALLNQSYDESFGGSGSTSRSGKVVATVAARVVGLFPNGDLDIAGFRQITVNEEVQTLVIRGTIRPYDIDPANEILSTQISDLQVFYVGSGTMDASTHPGWLSRILGKVWPF